MVAYPKKTALANPRMVKGAICPRCFKPVMYPAVLGATTDGYAREVRQYLGWCLECRAGFAVYQFRQNEKWYIHKYQLYELEVGETKGGLWQIINPMPEPAPVVIGPGGDYRKPIDIKTANLLKQCIGAFRKLCEVLGLLLKSETKKQNG